MSDIDLSDSQASSDSYGLTFDRNHNGRLFSMLRRRPNYVDLLIPRASSVVSGYKIQTAPNFDGAWTTLMTTTTMGFVDPSINQMMIDVQNTSALPWGPPVRIVFNPETYSLTDTKSFWLRCVPIADVVEGPAGAPTLVLPSTSNHGVGYVVIRGLAPTASDTRYAMQIDLPRLMQDFRIHNEDTTNPLFVSFEAGGSEVQLKASAQEQFTSILGTQSSIWVRGNVNFSATFTAAFPR